MSVSIIVPIYNVEKYVKECIYSVLSLNELDIEVIAVNDGSTDGSLAIVKEISEIDSRVKVYDYCNGGLSAARNRGLSHATKEYVLFLDSDDKLDISCLFDIYQKLKSDDLDCLLYEAAVFYDEGYNSVRPNLNYQRPKQLSNQILDGPELFSKLIKLERYSVSACMYVFKKELLGELKFYEGIYHEDVLFTTQLLLSGQFNRCLCQNIELYERRIREGSITTSEKSLKHVSGYFTVYNQLLSTLSDIKDKNTRESLKILMVYLLQTIAKNLISKNIYFTSPTLTMRLKVNYYYFIKHKFNFKVALSIFLPEIFKLKSELENFKRKISF
ncbi:glycosyltransferase family 2 protein [Vibrio breoganii]|uniref:glycosyltransferase family 2 protein n=1 Tax=Vibrio breoganii TaxID=553239 RepID=UPI000C84E3C2|nr:glycosyltransferase [Vibrio breoganii]PMO31943.1 hypothetical protein BCT12_17090 [Vibrio breoganii]